MDQNDVPKNDVTSDKNKKTVGQTISFHWLAFYLRIFFLGFLLPLLIEYVILERNNSAFLVTGYLLFTLYSMHSLRSKLKVYNGTDIESYIPTVILLLLGIIFSFFVIAQHFNFLNVFPFLLIGYIFLRISVKILKCYLVGTLSIKQRDVIGKQIDLPGLIDKDGAMRHDLTRKPFAHGIIISIDIVLYIYQLIRSLAIWILCCTVRCVRIIREGTVYTCPHKCGLFFENPRLVCVDHNPDHYARTWPTKDNPLFVKCRDDPDCHYVYPTWRPVAEEKRLVFRHPHCNLRKCAKPVFRLLLVSLDSLQTAAFLKKILSDGHFRQNDLCPRMPGVFRSLFSHTCHPVSFPALRPLPRS